MSFCSVQKLQMELHTCTKQKVTQTPHVLQPYYKQETSQRTQEYVKPLELEVEATSDSSSVIPLKKKISASNFLPNINYSFNKCPLPQAR